MNKKEINIIKDIIEVAKSKKINTSYFNKYSVKDMNMIQAVYYTGRDISTHKYSGDTLNRYIKMVQKSSNDIHWNITEYENDVVEKFLSVGLKHYNPLVSVLLSIYKVEEYLEECLDSILSQSYKNLEIVCVDNGSPDNCGKILKKYAQKDKRIKIITLAENKMLCGGRNTGLDNATGEFVCYVDPDDWIEKDHIKVMVDAIQNKKDSNGKFYNLIVNYNAVNYMVMQDKSIKPYPIYYNVVAGEKKISDFNFDPHLETDIPMWARLYRKSFLDKHKDIRFLDGINTDNIPYTIKLLAIMKRYYILKGEKNATYWRRLITPNGAVTMDVLYKNFEIPYCLDNLYEFLVKNHYEKQVKVIYHLFFTLCFRRHVDQFGYYQKFKNLMVKMENIIKTSGIYNESDITLCNLLIYSNGYFDFVSRYFSTPISLGTLNTSTVKLFNKIPIIKIHDTMWKKKYTLLNVIPIFEKKVIDNREWFKILGIPICKIIKS